VPYVRRHAEGRIVALFSEAAPDAQELLPSTHPDVMAFLGGGEAAAFNALDLDFVRVTEDLIYTLIEKGLLQFTDLPLDAQRKLDARDSFRKHRVAGALDLLVRRDAD
jgi:hypothetical protein